MAMYCQECGKKTDNDSEYCIHCGKKILDSRSISATLNTAVQPPQTSGDSAGKRDNKSFNWFMVLTVIVVVIILYFTWEPIYSLIEPEPTYDCSSKDGYIDITNGNNMDGYATLADKNNKKIKELFIAKNSKGRISQICNGRYYLYFKVGSTNNKFDQALDFRTTSSGSYKYYEVTLNPVVGGTASSSQVNESDYPH
jgi:hypothetical protein